MNLWKIRWERLAFLAEGNSVEENPVNTKPESTIVHRIESRIDVRRIEYIVQHEMYGRSLFDGRKQEKVQTHHIGIVPHAAVEIRQESE